MKVTAENTRNDANKPRTLYMRMVPVFVSNSLKILWHKVRIDAIVLGLFKTLYDIPRVEICVIKCLRIYLFVGIGTNIVPQDSNALISTSTVRAWVDPTNRRGGSGADTLTIPGFNIQSNKES